MNDNERLAASLKIGISNYVATAGLGVLAAAAALFTYVSQTFSPPWTFYALMILAAVLLVVAIAIGGDGADATVASVAKDEWHNVSIWQFNTQAVLTLIGLVAVLVATAIGASARRHLGEPERLARLEHSLTRLEAELGALHSEHATN